MDNPFSLEDPEPMLFIADITIRYEQKSQPKIVKNKRIYDVGFRTVEKYPVILLNNKPPSENYRSRLINSLSRFISQFREGTVTIHKIENIKFSSKLQYKFND